MAVQNHKAIVVVLAFAAFLATYNETVLNVAFAPIMQEFDLELTTVQWLACAYMLAVAVMIPIAGFAYQCIETRKLFCATLCILIVGTIIGGTGQSFAQILIARIIQACGSGLLIPTSMNLTVVVAPRQKLGFYMGLMAAMTTIGVSSAVIVSGLLMNVFTWHSLFWSYAIFLAICLAGALRYIGNLATLSHPRLDPLSVGLISLALIGILYGISISFSGNLALAAGSFIVGCLFLGLFVRKQLQLEEPLINLEVLRVKAFRVGVLLNLVALLSVFALGIIIPTFMQNVLGTSALYASLTLFPGVIVACIASTIAGKIYDRYGIKILLPLGCLFVAAFTLLLSLYMGSNNNAARVLLYIPIGMGAMLVIGPVQSYSLSRLKPAQNPHGITVMTTAFQIAGCLGSSVISGIYTLGANIGLQTGTQFNAAYEQGFLAAGATISALAVLGLGLSVYLIHDSIKKQIEKEHTVNTELAAVMKTDVFTLQENDTVLHALSMFGKKGISGAPIVDDEKHVVGFLSDGDVVRYLRDQSANFQSLYASLNTEADDDMNTRIEELMQLKATDIATKKVRCVDMSESIGSISKIMYQEHLKKVPVLKDSKLIGIVNRSTITSYAVNNYAETHGENK